MAAAGVDAPRRHRPELSDSDEGRNVAAGNAVRAAIAAADALCCLRLGRHARGQAHQDATALLKTIRPDGSALAKDWPPSSE